MVVQSPEQVFDLFVAAKNQEDVLEYFTLLKRHVLPTQTTTNNLSSPCSITFYHNLKQCIKSWRAESIWKILDERVNHKVYEGNVLCEGRRMLIIGAGPVGLRMAIECAFLGGDTHVIEKRASSTRNNILHLWPFTINDLRRLGAKKFYGQFCAGAIDHISIRQLQLILLKICCILGVNVHVGVEFRGLEEPCTDKSGKCSGWGIDVVPHPAPLPKWRWDAIVQASGRQHVLPLFQYKEFRGQQAIGMTVNFVNRGTMEELTIEEISGIAFIYNQEFFNDMYVELGIALENIVYYKDETHYFVMSTKKQSLLTKKVLKKDYPTTSELLSPDNIDYVKAQQFAREVAGFATNLPVLDFMTNHHGKADVAIFDFSAIKIAANSAMVLERHGERLMMCLVGDSLLEPFWPQGTGCARGFLSVLNSAWMFKKFFRGVQIYEVLRERESLLKLLAQSSPLKLNSKHDKYTIDPSTRYNYWTVSAEQFEVFHLYNREETPIVNNYLCSSTRTPTDIRNKRRTREDRRKTIQVTLNRSYSKEPDEKDTNSPTTPTLEQGSLLNWSRESTCGYRGVRVSNLTTTWKSGMAFAALIHRYRPDLLNFISVSTKTPEQILKTVFDTTHKEFGIKSPFTSKELATSSIPDRQRIIMYLTALHSHFTSEASKSLQISPDMCYFCSRHITPEQLASSHGIKFHSSCLKCEHCLDKISVNTLHFVNESMSDEYAKRRKPGYPDCKSGFYCKFHFREYFASKSSSLHPKNWLESRVTDYISCDTRPSSTEPSDTRPSSTEPIPPEPHSDTEENKVVLRENSHELRRAKSAASVRSLRDLFESISTGSPQQEHKQEVEKDEEWTGVKHLKNVPKSKSFSGLLPGTRNERCENEESKAGPVSPTFLPPKPKSAKKKKSGIAKKIERRQESGKVFAKPNVSKIDNDAVLCGPGVDQSLLGDSVAISHKKKSRFKLFKKKKPSGSSNNPPSPVLTSESNLDDTSSLVISNKSEHALTTQADAKYFNKSDSPKSDPLYTIVNPQYNYKPELPDDMDSLSDATSTSSFIRNSLSRRTAPPKMNRSISDEAEEIVDSNSCRRPSQIVQNLSRKAVVLQTNSPHARSLLRNSMRNSKRGLNAAFVKQNLNFQEDSVSLPSTPISSRVLIARTASAQALLNPVSDVAVSEAHVISKAVYSPKPKRAQKVKLDNVELLESPLKPRLTAEATIVHRKSCSPLPQRSKKVRLSMSRRTPLNMPIDSSSDEDMPPGRPELPKNLDLLLATNRPNENGFKPDVGEDDALPGRKISSGSSISTPSMTSALPAARNNSTDNLSSSMKSESSDHPSNNILSDSSYPSSADVFVTKTGSGVYRTFMYAKRTPANHDLLQKRLSLEGSGLTSDSSEYHTPGTHGSTPSQEVFYTPKQSVTGTSAAVTGTSAARRSSAPASSTVPAKRPSDTTVSGSSKRSSVAMDDVFEQGTTEDFETPNTTPNTSFVERPSQLRLDTLSKRDVPADKPPPPPLRRSVSTTENRVNRVLDEHMSSKDHSSINKILAKYRRIPSTPSDTTGNGRISETTRDEPKRSISERQTSKMSASGPPSERKNSAGPQHRVKMIAHLSNSFDKTIDRLVNKYYPKKDVGRQSTAPSRDASKDSSSPSRDTVTRHSYPTGSDDSNSKTSLLSRDSQKSSDSSRGTDRKTSESSSTPTRDYKRRSSQEPARTSSYEGIKRHPSTPSRYYSYKSGNSPRDSKSSSSSQDSKSGDNSSKAVPNRDIIKTSRDSISSATTTPRGGVRTRQSSDGSSSTISRDSARQLPATPAKRDNVTSEGTSVWSREGSKQSSVQSRDSELSTPTARPLTTLSRETSLNSPSTTPVKETPFRSVTAEKLRYSRNRRAQSLNAPSSCECRSVPHTPTCKGYRSRDNGKKFRDDGKKVRDSTSTEEEAENIAYIELHDGERLKQWDKKDYSRYLKSLRYQGSVMSRKDSFNVKNTVQAFQRKETDV